MKEDIFAYGVKYEGVFDGVKREIRRTISAPGLVGFYFCDAPDDERSVGEASLSEWLRSHHARVAERWVVRVTLADGTGPILCARPYPRSDDQQECFSYPSRAEAVATAATLANRFPDHVYTVHPAPKPEA